MLIHVEASCLFVDLCLSPMLPLLNSEGSQLLCIYGNLGDLFVFALMMVIEETYYTL